MHTFIRSFFVLGVLASAADAHVGISSGPAQANKSSVVTFSVGHGCTSGADHLDTVKIKITIPAGVDAKELRALPSDLGKLFVHRDGDGNVDYVEWSKPSADALASDDAYYEVKLRLKPLTATAYSKLSFNVEQTCNNPAGTNPVVVNWDGSASNTPPASLTVVPQRVPGWNKITVARALTQDEVPTYFGESVILWKGTAAFSPSSATAMMIAMTPGVTTLTDGLAANDEIWVKY